MDKITISGQEYPLAIPEDGAGQLLAATGLSPAEIVAHLGEGSNAGIIAAALCPFLDGEKPALADLAEQLVAELAADRFGLIAKILPLLGALALPVAAPSISVPAEGETE